MSELIAALPMYDWPEVQAQTDEQWVRLRDALRREGIDAPENLVRRNGDLPPVPDGVRDASGAKVALNPSMLPPDGFDPHAVWLHPALLLAQTCWGPMGQGLERHVQVVGQPDYSAFEGGQGVLYSSALVMRRGAETGAQADRPLPTPAADLRPDPPHKGEGKIPLELLRGQRLAYNSADSMSGILAFTSDLEAMGETLALFAERIETGGHRASVVAVAEDRADVASIDCRSWAMARRFEPAAQALQVVGWTALRKGLPFITARTTSNETVTTLRQVLASAGTIVG